jgi:hypothetical protein
VYCIRRSTVRRRLAPRRIFCGRRRQRCSTSTGFGGKLRSRNDAYTVAHRCTDSNAARTSIGFYSCFFFLFYSLSFPISTPGVFSLRTSHTHTHITIAIRWPFFSLYFSLKHFSFLLKTSKNPFNSCACTLSPVYFTRRRDKLFPPPPPLLPLLFVYRRSRTKPLNNMSSWQDYVDKHLLASRCVTKAAIAGHDGNVWAKSEGFDVSINGLCRP